MIYAIGITKKEIPLKPKEPLPLHHSWPLFDHERHLDLCAVLGADAPALAEALHCPQTGAELARKGVGVWQCDLADNALTWSAGVPPKTVTSTVAILVEAKRRTNGTNRIKLYFFISHLQRYRERDSEITSMW